MSTAPEHERSHGFSTDLVRAIGWVALGKGIAKLPRPPRPHGRERPRARRDAPMRSSRLLTAAAAFVGLLLALVPHAKRGHTRVAAIE